jgi:hypothetical protein
MKTSFTTFEICHILHIPWRRFREWQDRGFMEPSIKAADGAGSKALFSIDDLRLCAVALTLIDSGTPRDHSFFWAKEIITTKNFWNRDYLTFKVRFIRKVERVNGRTGKADKKRLDLFAGLEISTENFRNISLKSGLDAPDILLVLNLKKIKEQISAAVGVK